MKQYGRRGQERRKHYRIEDEVGLDYFVIEHPDDDNDDTSDEHQDEQKYAIAKAAIKTLDEEFSAVLSTIEREHFEVYQYIKAMNQKINILSRLAFADPELKTKNVNISASGIAFNTSKAFKYGTKLAIELTLYPAYEYLDLTGTVVRCQKAKDEPDLNDIAVKFYNLSREHEQILARHVFKLQAEAIRKQKDLEE